MPLRVAVPPRSAVIAISACAAVIKPSLITRAETGTALWLAKRQQELLPANYFHLVFSVPHALVPLMWQNQRRLFSLLFDRSAATLLEVAADPRHLGAEIGFLAILHTWGQRLQQNPHS